MSDRLTHGRWHGWPILALFVAAFASAGEALGAARPEIRIKAPGDPLWRETTNGEATTGGVKLQLRLRNIGNKKGRFRFEGPEGDDSYEIHYFENGKSLPSTFKENFAPGQTKRITAEVIADDPMHLFRGSFVLSNDKPQTGGGKSEGKSSKSYALTNMDATGRIHVELHLQKLEPFTSYGVELEGADTDADSDSDSDGDDAEYDLGELTTNGAGNGTKKFDITLTQQEMLELGAIHFEVTPKNDDSISTYATLITPLPLAWGCDEAVELSERNKGAVKLPLLEAEGSNSLASTAEATLVVPGDLMVRVSGSSAWQGEGVISGSPSDQTASATVSPQATTSYEVRLRNVCNASVSYRLREASSHAQIVDYRRNGTEVTEALQSPRGLSTGILPPSGTFTFTARTTPVGTALKRDLVFTARVTDVQGLSVLPDDLVSAHDKTPGVTTVHQLNWQVHPGDDSVGSSLNQIDLTYDNAVDLSGVTAQDIRVYEDDDGDGNIELPSENITDDVQPGGFSANDDSDQVTVVLQGNYDIDSGDVFIMEVRGVGNPLGPAKVDVVFEADSASDRILDGSGSYRAEESLENITDDVQPGGFSANDASDQVTVVLQGNYDIDGGDVFIMEVRGVGNPSGTTNVDVVFEADSASDNILDGDDPDGNNLVVAQDTTPGATTAHELTWPVHPGDDSVGSSLNQIDLTYNNDVDLSGVTAQDIRVYQGDRDESIDSDPDGADTPKPRDIAFQRVDAVRARTKTTVMDSGEIKLRNYRDKGFLSEDQ